MMVKKINMQCRHIPWKAKDVRESACLERSGHPRKPGQIPRRVWLRVLQFCLIMALRHTWKSQLIQLLILCLQLLCLEGLLDLGSLFTKPTSAHILHCCYCKVSIKSTHCWGPAKVHIPPRTSSKVTAAQLLFFAITAHLSLLQVCSQWQEREEKEYQPSLTLSSPFDWGRI